MYLISCVFVLYNVDMSVFVFTLQRVIRMSWMRPSGLVANYFAGHNYAGFVGFTQFKLKSLCDQQLFGNWKLYSPHGSDESPLQNRCWTEMLRVCTACHCDIVTLCLSWWHWKRLQSLAPPPPHHLLEGVANICTLSLSSKTRKCCLSIEITPMRLLVQEKSKCFLTFFEVV